MYTFLNLSNLKDKKIIHDVIIHPLRVNRDPRGILIEGMKINWEDVFDKDKKPFTMMYFSTTDSGVARDEGKWHFHPAGQQDRFGVIRGNIVVAMYDYREESPTYKTLNLFHLGEDLGDDGQYLLLVPERVYHGFVVVGDKAATLYNFPTKLYDPEQEVRIPMADTPLADGSIFSYQDVFESFKK